ncbi:hypothetical protein KQH62_04285 [bacterium]|nr:hypothetical protein [bacterium]
MKSYGLSSVSAFLGDQIVFRNLLPCDSRIPSLPDLRKKLGFPADFLPRKSMAEYGKVIAEMVRAARWNSDAYTSIERIIYIGDTRMNDGQAFLNICKASRWEGVVFIGADRPGPAQFKIEQVHSETMVLASRWKALDQFETYLSEQGFPVDEQTAVLFDLDKTILGARGRNDQVIDAKRLAAAEVTLEAALGSDYNPEVFRDAYQLFNQAEFHAFTADNQDYLVYICLIVSSGLISQAELADDVRNAKIDMITDFLSYIEARRAKLPEKVARIHQDVYARVRAGDPTPFKSFRHNEFRRTVAHMGQLPEDAPVDQIIAEEIVITAEILNLALRWQDQGAILFGLSDKPDEAVLPSAAMREQGILPIHQTMTHVIGEE